MPMSLNLADKIGALIKDNTPIPAYASANRYLALHHSDPTNICLLDELIGDNYARVLIPLEIIQLAKGKGLSNNEVIVWPIASGTKLEQITHGSVWDSLVGGTPISYAALTAPANWVSGHSMSLAINAFIQLLRDTI